MPYDYDPVLLKFELMTAGVKLDESVSSEADRTIKAPSFTKAGAGTSGLDLVLQKSVYVSALVHTRAAAESSFVLARRDGGYVILKEGRPIQQVALVPRPSYYDRTTSDGVPMKQIGQVTGDFVGFALDNRCAYWLEGGPCWYCSIGANAERGHEREIKDPSQVVEVVTEALKEPTCEHAQINAGTFPRPDRGAGLYSRVVRAIKDRHDIWIRAVLMPPDMPEGKRYIDMLYDAGLDSVQFNLEVFNEERRRIVCPAKARDVSQETYFRALEYAVQKFGPGRVDSNLVEGMETPQDTARGAEFLASLGVTPTIHIFRPVPGARLQNWPTTPLRNLVWLYRRLRESLLRHRVDAACAGCNRRRVNTKIYEGRIAMMPPIPESAYPDLDPVPTPLPAGLSQSPP